MNACVCEVIFLSKVAELVPDKGAAIIVYGAGGESLDAVTAADKVEKASFANVAVFSVGIAESACRSKERVRKPVHTPNNVHEVDTETSVVRCALYCGTERV